MSLLNPILIHEEKKQSPPSICNAMQLVGQGHIYGRAPLFDHVKDVFLDSIDLAPNTETWELKLVDLGKVKFHHVPQLHIALLVPLLRNHEHYPSKT